MGTNNPLKAVAMEMGTEKEDSDEALSYKTKDLRSYGGLLV
jgi:hypothetical protein